MKIVIAPDKFKGSLTAAEAAEAMARGVRRVLPEASLTLCPIADGGEGTARALAAALEGEWIEREVEGPLGDPVKAGYAWMAAQRLAVVEMSEASGLVLVAPERRRALEASSYGTGELIRDAVERGAERIVVGLGGSATSDGGVGMAAALGIRFLNESGEVIERPVPANFYQIARIENDAVLPEIIGASDVRNPLLGERGAARVFSPQKGATSEEVVQIEQALERLHQQVERDLGRTAAHEPGAGAAGGLGFGLIAFTGATLRPGFDLVAEILGLEAKVRGADLVLTGEGSIDLQTLEGKGPAGVAALAQKSGCPAIAIGGRVVDDPRVWSAFTGIMPMVNEPMTLPEAMSRAAELLEAATARAVRFFPPARILSHPPGL